MRPPIRSVVQVRPEPRIDAVEHRVGLIAERGDDDDDDEGGEQGEHDSVDPKERADAGDTGGQPPVASIPLVILS